MIIFLNILNFSFVRLISIMPIQSFSTFIRMTEFCGIHVPKTIMDLLLPVKDDDDAVKEIGCKISVDLCRSIVSAQLPDVEGFHFYTLNLERSVTRILDSMKTVVEQPILAVDDWRSKISSPISESGGIIDKALIIPNQRPLPWRPSTMDKRAKEEIRPINWANRPKSYVAVSLLVRCLFWIVILFSLRSFNPCKQMEHTANR